MESRILREVTMEKGTSLPHMVAMGGQIHGEQDPQGGHNGEGDQPPSYGGYGDRVHGEQDPQGGHKGEGDEPPSYGGYGDRVHVLRDDEKKKLHVC